MEKNQIVGLVLMLVMLTVYFQFFAPDPPPQPEKLGQENVDTVKRANATPMESSVAALEIPDSLKNAVLFEQYGAFATIVKEDAGRDVTIENEVMRTVLSSQGAKIKEIELKTYKSFDGSPLVLLNEESSNLNISFFHSGKKIALQDLSYSVSTSDATLNKDDTLKVSFIANIDSTRSIEQIYTFNGNGYQIGHEIKTNGLNGLVDQRDLELKWINNLRVLEKDLEQTRARTSIVYAETGEVSDLSSRSVSLEEEDLENTVDWFSFSQKFFTSGIITKSSPFQQGYLSMVGDEKDSTVVKTMTAEMTIPVNDVMGAGYAMEYYFGPNNYKILKTVTPGFDANVDLGWSVLKIINKWLIINIFQWLEQYISNYGIIIMIMVILIKLMLSPLTYKSHMSMAKMRVLKPELDEIKERVGDDMQKVQVEQMELYKKAGINPLSGCIPMVLQMPVLFAMFYFFPNSIELRQEAFLWADDLSTYDSVIDFSFTIPFYGDHVSLFTLLMTASTILYTWSNSRVSSVTGPMKTMQYVMPVMFLFFLNNYSAGLTFYYFVSNIVSFGQIALFRKFVDEDKIKKIMEENKKKNANKKKSKFQSRLEDAMKASEQARKEKSKKK